MSAPALGITSLADVRRTVYSPYHRNQSRFCSTHSNRPRQSQMVFPNHSLQIFPTELEEHLAWQWRSQQYDYQDHCQHNLQIQAQIWYQNHSHRKWQFQIPPCVDCSLYQYQIAWGNWVQHDWMQPRCSIHCELIQGTWQHREGPFIQVNSLSSCWHRKSKEQIC